MRKRIKQFTLRLQTKNSQYKNFLIEGREYPLSTVTVVSLDQHHLLSYILALFWGTETNKTTNTGVCLLVSMCNTHSASDAHIKALQFTIVTHNGDEAKIVRKDVDVVGRWNGNSNFELQPLVNNLARVSVRLILRTFLGR